MTVRIGDAEGIGRWPSAREHIARELADEAERAPMRTNFRPHRLVRRLSARALSRIKD
ncbi:hypothetical protein [Amycolatopsis pigmentata]|uniref:Uncharacterized protein n=1 Tax=Amycolatopsis pigmentata TaxID=450801 RepID=A0ABW5FY65_9PSEU